MAERETKKPSPLTLKPLKEQVIDRCRSVLHWWVTDRFWLDILLLHQDEEVQEEAEAMDEEEQEWEEMEAILLEEFPPVEEEEAEDEETETSAEERLETEISQRFERDESNLTSMTVRRSWKLIL